MCLMLVLTSIVKEHTHNYAMLNYRIKFNNFLGRDGHL